MLSRKPKLDVYNFEPFYAALDEKENSAWLGPLTFKLLDHFYKPTMHASDDTQGFLSDALDRNAQIIVASEHGTRHRPFQDGAMAGQLSVFDRIGRDITIMAYSKMFENPLSRWFTEGVGGVPTWREKDDESIVALARKAANERMIQTMIKRVNRGMHALVYPEGHTNKVDIRTVQQLQLGIGRLVCEVNDDIELIVLPIGHAHAADQRFQRFPHIVLGDPYIPTRTSPEAVVRELAPRLQSPVTEAYKFLDSAAQAA